MACPATDPTGMFRRHTIRGIRRRTLCAMRSAPRNGAVALGRMSHRPLEALRKAQQASNGAFVRGVQWSLMAWRSLPVAGHARLPRAFPVLSTPRVGTMATMATMVV
jgi:hypothetical protein